MEYLLDNSQTVAASQMLNNSLQPDELEKEIEQLRAAFYQLQFNSTPDTSNIDEISRRAYLLATLASSPMTDYAPNVVGKALSVAAVIFEYLSQLATKPEERLNYTINAILFYSRGEQEAQSATLAKKALYHQLSIDRAVSPA